MKRLFTLDASMHSSGIAVFEDHKLIATEVIKVSNKIITKEAVIEMINLLVAKFIEYEPDVLVAEIQKPQHLKRLFALDASMHSSGIAVFEDHKLIATEVIKVSNKIIAEAAVIEMINLLVAKFIEYVPDVLVAEIQKPQHKGERMSTQALMHLAAIPLGVLGVAKNLGKEVHYYQPHTWKGSVPKLITLKRIFDQEVKLKTKPYLFADQQSDIMDAIGIGRYYLARNV